VEKGIKGGVEVVGVHYRLNPGYEGDCDFDTDCSMGFYCYRKYKESRYVEVTNA